MFWKEFAKILNNPVSNSIWTLLDTQITQSSQRWSQLKRSRSRLKAIISSTLKEPALFTMTMNSSQPMSSKSKPEKNLKPMIIQQLISMKNTTERMHWLITNILHILEFSNDGTISREFSQVITCKNLVMTFMLQLMLCSSSFYSSVSDTLQRLLSILICSSQKIHKSLEARWSSACCRSVP